MNEVFNLIIGEAVDPLEKVFMMALFLIMFEGLIEIICQLLKMGGRK